jgi:hypothetical protein
LGEAQSLIQMLADVQEEQREQVRRRLKGRIRELVQGLWVVIVRHGRRCLCAVQIWFRGADKCRHYLITHKPGTRYTEGDWGGKSLTTTAKLGDLRKQNQPRRLQTMLATVDLKDA